MNKNSKSPAERFPELDLKRAYYIESSRFLPHLPKSHPCAKVHGHSFAIDLTFRGPIDAKLGWVMDYSEIDVHVQKILRQIDHQSLNSVTGLENPTTEILCLWIFSRVEKLFRGPVRLKKISIRETRDSECTYP